VAQNSGIPVIYATGSIRRQNRSLVIAIGTPILAIAGISSLHLTAILKQATCVTAGMVFLMEANGSRRIRFIQQDIPAGFYRHLSQGNVWCLKIPPSLQELFLFF
jgi:hypothetical protein